MAFILAVVVFAFVYFIRADNQGGYGSITVVKDIENPEEVPDNFLVDNFYIELTKAGEQVGFEAIYPPNPNPDYINQFTFSDLDPGDYTLFEWMHPNWDFVGVSCDNGFESEGSTLAFALVANENVTCTFTNELRKSSITVYKAADSDGEFGFALNGPTSDLTTIQTTEGTGSATFFDLTPSYTRTSYPESLFNSLPYTLTELGEVNPTINCISDLAIVRSDSNIQYIQDGYAVEISLLPGENLACYFNNTDQSLISGQKFHDLDADTQRASLHDHDYDEPFLSGWNINLYKYNPEPEEGGLFYELFSGTQTDSNGYYLFPHLDPGDYRLCEDMEPDFTQSFPVWMGENDPGNGSCDYINSEFNGHTILIEEEEYENFIGYDFGNYRNAAITVRKFNDLNFNGIFDDGEPGIPDWPINLSGNDFLEATTGEDGLYLFTDILPRGYELCEGTLGGWLQTYPAVGEEDNGSAGCHSFTVFSGDDLTFDFGNFFGSLITGYKFNDLDGDGSWYQYGESEQPVEPGISDWPIALGKVTGEPNDDGLIPIEIVAMTLTSVDGSFTLPVKEPGQYYKVFEGSKAGFRTTTPTPVPLDGFPIDSFFDITYPIDILPINLNTDSFFGVSVEGLGERIEHDQNRNPLWFGNQAIELDLPEGGGLSSSFNDDGSFNVFKDDIKVVTLPAGTDTGDIFIQTEENPNDLGATIVSGVVLPEGETKTLFVNANQNTNLVCIIDEPTVSLSQVTPATSDLCGGVVISCPGINGPYTCSKTDGQYSISGLTNSGGGETNPPAPPTPRGGSSGGYLPGYGPKAPVIAQAPAPIVPSPISVPIFTRNLAYSSRGEDVRNLQKYLNNRGFLVALSGYGSKGQETDIFGLLTKAALIKFQEANATQILKPYGLTRGTGVFGILTKQFINSHL